jgi:hypothetical protein
MLRRMSADTHALHQHPIEDHQQGATGNQEGDRQHQGDKRPSRDLLVDPESLGHEVPECRHRGQDQRQSERPQPAKRFRAQDQGNENGDECDRDIQHGSIIVRQ